MAQLGGQLGGQPILVLPEGAQRLLGRDAQRTNISVARAVASAIRTTLGPKGMDKMLVDDLGDIVITNDGATILDEMNIEHPAGKMMVEVAKTQDEEVGDGTTTAVVIAGELLKNAEEMLDQKIHPSLIVRGYSMASDKCIEILNKNSIKVSPEDDEKLKQIAKISLTGKGAARGGEKFAEIVVKAVKQVAETRNGKLIIDKDYIKVEKKQGGDVLDTELINGIVIDKERVHSGMPKLVKNAKIGLLDAALEVKETETNAEIRITSPEQLQGFLEQEEKMLKDMVEHIKSTGANVIFCQKGIDDLAQHFLAKEGIFAVRRVKKSDMEKLSKATGAKVITSIKDLSSTDLGEAGRIEEKKIAGENMVFIEDCKEPKAVTILIRGGTEHVVDEAERSIDDAIGVVASTLEDGKVVLGGGCIETELSLELEDYAKTIGGREQLAIMNFAKAIEVIPRTLAESTGMDPIDTLVDLKAKHQQGNKTYGVDVLKAKAADMEKLKVLEPTRIKEQAIASASEVAEMILRIDDIIAASSKGKEGGGMPGGMPGAGGMPGY
ncbi:MAG: TCP-1/cpn60 chaperonin family protein [Candidatus Diapherotrites archaeon]|nr:TCP-1/cpn60 chaperonin family protein [Candidatus Diapherotrites archaeon]